MTKSALSLVLSALFCLGILVTPWFFGGNLPIVRSIALGVVCISLLVLCALPNMLGSPTRKSLLMSSLLLAGIGYAALQILPVDGSPIISDYAAGTRARICELVLGVGVFFVASHLFRNQSLIPWLFGLIALNGVLLTFIGLAQIISDSDKLYWYFELTHGGAPFGPFVNGNNAGGYLLMCFSAANFFLAQRVFRSLHQRKQHQEFSRQASVLRKLLNVVGRNFARIQPQQLYVTASLAAIAAGVFASMSRGASVALIASILVGWGLLFRRNLAFAFAALAILAAGVGIVLWVQQEDVVAANLGSFSEVASTNTNRIAQLKVSWDYSMHYLPLGSGLGTYGISSLPFQTRPFKKWYKYAENQYLESLAELGIPGLALLLAVIGIAAYGCFRLLSKPDSASRAVGLTGLICLISQMIAGAFDFGLYQPANMFLMATLMGVVFAQLNWSWSASHVAPKDVPVRRIRIAWTMAFVLALLSGWACYEYTAVDARQACRRFYERFDPVVDRSKVPFYQGLAEYAVRIRPDDAEAHHQLALNHVLSYRLAASDAMVAEVKQADELLAQESSEPAISDTASGQLKEFSFADAWPRSTLMILHLLARASRNQGGDFFDLLKESEPVKLHLAPAWKELNLAKQQCDKFWFFDLGLAQLCLLMGEEEKEDELINDAISLSNDNPEVLYVGGMLKLQSGNLPSAFAAWHQCLTQTREYESAIIEFCRNEIGIRDFFDQVLPSDPRFRLRLAKKYFASPEDLTVRKLLLAHTKTTMDQHELPDAERNFLLGEMERLSENHPAAIHYYAKALKLDKHRIDWRVQYSRSLIAAEMFEQAIAELKYCALYHGEHYLLCQRLLTQAKQLRKKSLTEQRP